MKLTTNIFRTGILHTGITLSPNIWNLSGLFETIFVMQSSARTSCTWSTTKLHVVKYKYIKSTSVILCDSRSPYLSDSFLQLVKGYLCTDGTLFKVVLFCFSPKRTSCNRDQVLNIPSNHMDFHKGLLMCLSIIANQSTYHSQQHLSSCFEHTSRTNSSGWLEALTQHRI